MNIDKKNHSEKPWYKRYPAEMMLATQRLTFAQRGIYWTIQDHLWFEIHEGGLDEEYIKDICKDAEDSDVYKVLQLFFKKDGDLYYSKHLRNQYQDIIQKSENARKGWEAKKKAQSENTDDSITEKAEREQKQSTLNAETEQTRKTCSSFSNSNSNSNSIYNNTPQPFETFWNLVENKIGKGQALRNWRNVSKEWQKKPEELAKMYNKYFSDKVAKNEQQYAQRPSTWLNDMGYENQPPDTFKIKDQDREQSDKNIRRSRWELAIKQDRPLYNMSITEFNNLKEEFGEHL